MTEAQVCRSTWKPAPENLLSGSDLKTAKAEAAELRDALNSRDVTGSIKKG
ncbi:hypothetical protein [Streptomyces sp. NPDC007074]|uniref:hypothetical protein n=1 Tax=Streptomyces sp. NPDC007074 TaxID=3156764 RepID=UPI0033D74372